MSTSKALNRSLALLATAFSLAVPATAGAHAHLVDPPPRDAPLTPGPCGGPGIEGEHSTFAPGETITVQWIQDVAHGGSYRISFSPANDEGFEDNVLLEIPEDGQAVNYSESVTLPMCECDDCTLQMWQVVGTGGYYSCADIELHPDVPGSVDPCVASETPDPSGGDDTVGGSTSGGEDTTGEVPNDGSTSGDPPSATGDADGTTGAALPDGDEGGSSSGGTADAQDAMDTADSGCNIGGAGGLPRSGWFGWLGLGLIFVRRRRGITAV